MMDRDNLCLGDEADFLSNQYSLPLVCDSCASIHIGGDAHLFIQSTRLEYEFLVEAV